MRTHRQLWFVRLLLGVLATGCAGGRGSGGFDIAAVRALKTGSELAVSNVQALIEFGKAKNGGAGASSSPRGSGAADSWCTEDDFCYECVEEDGLFTASTYWIGAPRGGQCPPECRHNEVFLSSTDAGTCDGVVPDDISVSCGLRNMLSRPTRFLDFEARFDPSGEGTGCATPQSFGLISPAFNICTGASKGTMTLNGFSSDLEGRFVGFSDFSVDLVAAGSPCFMRATLNGQLEWREQDRTVQLTTVYNDFRITEREDGDGVLVTQDGSLTTDCVGDLEYETLEPLRLTAGATCPTAGLLRITLPDGATSLTRYTETGGVELDFGADGEVDQVFETCTDPDFAQCVAELPPELCAPCESHDDCGGDLVCLPCLSECTDDTARCVEPDDLGGCEDGTY